MTVPDLVVSPPPSAAVCPACCSSPSDLASLESEQQAPANLAAYQISTGTGACDSLSKTILYCGGCGLTDLCPLVRIMDCQLQSFALSLQHTKHFHTDWHSLGIQPDDAGLWWQLSALLMAAYLLLHHDVCQPNADS